jgi:hypothetical protein
VADAKLAQADANQAWITAKDSADKQFAVTGRIKGVRNRFAIGECLRSVSRRQSLSNGQQR